MRRITTKKIFSTLCILCFSLFLLLISKPLISYGDTTNVIDSAELLSSQEEESLQDQIEDIKSRYSFEIVLHTTTATEGKTIRDYSDDFFDYNGYGSGPSRDGLIFVLDINNREYYSSTSGYGITAFTDYGLDFIHEKITSTLSDGDYYKALSHYLNLSDDLLKQATQGDPLDVGTKKPVNKGILVLIATAVSFIIALIVTGIMRLGMNTVGKNSKASNYVKNESLNLTEKRDLFLYKNVTRIKKPEPSSKGGSSTHRSSSGRSHGGRGGSF